MTIPIPHPRIKLAICTPIPAVAVKGGGTRLSSVSYEWHVARLRLQMPLGYDVAEIQVVGREVGEARNMAAQTARDTGVEWLFWLDYDVLPAPGTLKQLLYRATATHLGFDIYSGVYCVKGHPSVPILYKGWNTGPFWGWDFGDVLMDGIVCSGLGCALMRVDCLDRLPNTTEKPWFQTWQDPGGHGTATEDCWFTKRLIEEAEGKILVDCANICVCGHQDQSTGEIYCLEPDAPPVTRAGIAAL